MMSLTPKALVTANFGRETLAVGVGEMNTYTYTVVRNWVTGELGRVLSLQRSEGGRYVLVALASGRAWWPLLSCEPADAAIGGAA